MRSPTIDPGILCDGSLIDNAAQTDILTGDISFFAVQSRNNPNFTCDGEECFEQVYTASVFDYQQGTKKNGDPINDPERTDPTKANGAPDWVEGTGTNFYSLGRDLDNDQSQGWVMLAFENPVSDGPGEDLSIHEATNFRNSYALEQVSVEVSDDGNTWYPVGTATSEPGGDGVTYLDVSDSGLDTFQYVRLQDTTPWGPHDPTADGFDLDAVDAVYGACEERPI